MTFVDWVIVLIALLVAFLGHVNLLACAIAAVVLILLIKLVQGQRPG